ncbi:MAG: HPF/RaiA family ribosome-associated protein [Gemmatimonadota bacterium]|nr:HPF/RaiA family ribosome-associated protein [Gemmatimonadota bacterium]
MEIILHAHHADVPANLQRDAIEAVQQIAVRLRRAVDAIVRFESDGPERRVEIVLRAPRHKEVIAEGFDRQFEPALALALSRLQTQVARDRRARRHVRGDSSA